MDKDLYIEFLESEIRRIRAGGSNPEVQDLKLENDRLKKRDEIMHHFIKSVRCKEMICEYCDLHYCGPKGQDFCAQVKHDKLESIADEILKKLEDL